MKGHTKGVLTSGPVVGLNFQMKIAGRNHIFPPLSIIMEAIKKRKFH